MFSKKLVLSILALGCGAAFMLTSCNKQIEGTEKTHPLYIKAAKDREAGQYNLAAKELSDLLTKAPRSALIHKELAELYKKMEMPDYYRAIYHMSRYLELSEGQISAEDKRIANNEIEDNKRLAAEEYSKSVGGMPATENMNAVDPAEYEKLQRDYENNLNALNAFKKALKDTRAELEALKSQKATSAKTATPNTETATAAPRTGNATASATKFVDGETFDYVVQSGDTLGRIVKKTYKKDSPAIVKKIVELNGLKNASAIKLGQTLKMPKIAE